MFIQKGLNYSISRFILLHDTGVNWCYPCRRNCSLLKSLVIVHRRWSHPISRFLSIVLFIVCREVD